MAEATLGSPYALELFVERLDRASRRISHPMPRVPHAPRTDRMAARMADPGRASQASPAQRASKTVAAHRRREWFVLIRGREQARSPVRGLADKRMFRLVHLSVGGLVGSWRCFMTLQNEVVTVREGDAVPAAPAGQETLDDRPREGERTAPLSDAPPRGHLARIDPRKLGDYALNPEYSLTASTNRCSPPRSASPTMTGRISATESPTGSR